MNTETKHTPTPWNLHHFYDGEPIVVLRDDGTSFTSAEFYIAQGEKIIGTVIMRAGAGGWPNVENHAEAKANAELIISACNSYHSDQAKIKALTEALDRLVYVIDAAGLNNLSQGVQLGVISWYHKASDAMTDARAALSLAKS